MCISAGDRDRDEPDHHDRPEEARDAGGAAPLHREQADQDGDRERHDEMLEGRDRELEALDRRQAPKSPA